MSFIYVGLGGGLGAICRYLISMLSVKSDFPVLTLVTNLLGAIAIGLIGGITERNENLSPNVSLFFKTGSCGGFTTFSTFSLETYNLSARQNTFSDTCTPYSACSSACSACGAERC